MFLRPSSFQEYLTKNGYIDELYDALAKDDLSKIVTAALSVLKKTHNLPHQIPSKKCEKFSTQERNKGNDALRCNNYQLAMVHYNQAMLIAPPDSNALVLAIGNRSAVFQKSTAYTASLKDIEFCLSMNCPGDLINKLKKRRREVMGLANQEGMSTHFYKMATKKNFTCNTNNPELPCATTDIKAVESVVPKIVAAKDIKVGSPITSERAYVSYTDRMNILFCCHFCQKMSLNLIPCERCLFALFCDEECKSQCFKEYHRYECSIMNITTEICFSPVSNLMVKAALKMRSNSKSWNEFVEASRTMGIERMKSSSVKEVCDNKSVFAPLNIRDDDTFTYSVKFDASFVCASIIHFLERHPTFFPKNEQEKKLAMEAFGRIMMFLSIHIKPQKLFQAATVLKTDRTNYYKHPNYGFFTFIGKINNCCTPNVVACNINNMLTLIAIQGIKSGEEITLSYQKHWLESSSTRRERNVSTFLYHGKVCTCSICIGKEETQQLSKSQKKYFNSINLDGIDHNLQSINISLVYDQLLEALDVLKDVPFSNEYKQIYLRFSKCKLFYEYFLGHNTILG